MVNLAKWYVLQAKTSDKDSSPTGHLQSLISDFVVCIKISLSPSLSFGSSVGFYPVNVQTANRVRQTAC